MAAEASSYIHSEEERAEMLNRIGEFASKDELSAQELVDLGYLLMDRDADKKMLDAGDTYRDRGIGQYIFAASPKTDQETDFQIYNDSNRRELIELEEDIESLAWRVSFLSDALYSGMLSRKIEVSPMRWVSANDILTSRDHASIAKRLVTDYLGTLPQ